MFECLSPAGVIAAALTALPGPDVLCALAGIDHSTLSDSAQVDLLVALERQAAWLAAFTLPVLAGVGNRAQAAAEAVRSPGDGTDMPMRAAHAEIAVALRMSENVAASRLDAARDLTGPLTAVHAALAAGDISLWHANAIYDSTLGLTAEQRALVAEKVLPRARHQTVAQLRRCLRRAVLAVAPQRAEERTKKAHAERKVDFWPLPDGMAELRLIASAADVLRVYGTLDTIAHQQAQGHPVGSPGWMPIAARRADTLIAMVLGTSGGGSPVKTRVDLNLTMDLPTLLGLQDNPAELAGYGPLPAPLARALAADGSWRRLIHDPQTGALLDLGHTSYQPSAALTRYICARDGVCAFPTCNRTAQHCDLDHTRRYTPDDPGGGGTDRVNLGPLCGFHHRLKHETGWTLRRDPTTGEATWTSPTNHSYPVAPHDHRSILGTDLPEEPAPPPVEFADVEPPVTPNDTPERGNWYIPDDPDQTPDPEEPADAAAYNDQGAFDDLALDGCALTYA